jgi:hypothetical protein
MEFLNILKKHYEKVILSVVLLGLAIAAAMLLLRVAAERERLDEVRRMNLVTAPRAIEPTDVSTNLIVLNRLQNPTPVVLHGTNNLFNPVQWQRRADQRLDKIVTGDETGPGALRITEIKPLYLLISFEGEIRTADLLQYQFRVERQAAASVAERRAVTRSFTSVGSRNAGLLLREMHPRDEPREFVFESLDDKAEIRVTRDEPHRSVAGFAVDLRYEPERRTFVDRRIGDSLRFAGDENKIVAITATNVTVEASNRKRTTIAYDAAAAFSLP